MASFDAVHGQSTHKKTCPPENRDHIKKESSLPTIIFKVLCCWVVVSNIFYFYPEPWGRFPFWQAYFSDGWFNYQPVYFSGFQGSIDFLHSDLPLEYVVNSFWLFLEAEALISMLSQDDVKRLQDFGYYKCMISDM